MFAWTILATRLPEMDGWRRPRITKFTSADGTNLEQVQPDDTFKSLATLGSASDPIDVICPDRQGGIWAALAKSIFHWTSGRFVSVKGDPRWAGNLIYGCAVDGANELWVSIGRQGLFLAARRVLATDRSRFGSPWGLADLYDR